MPPSFEPLLYHRPLHLHVLPAACLLVAVLDEHVSGRYSISLVASPASRSVASPPDEASFSIVRSCCRRTGAFRPVAQIIFREILHSHADARLCVLSEEALIASALPLALAHLA